MDERGFESLISRLEKTATAYPRRYLALVVAVALLGFGVLAVAILFALLPAALLAGLLFLVVITGGKALIILLKLGKLLVLLVIPAWVMIKSSIQMIFTRFPRPQGRTLSAAEAPALFARISELRQKLNGPRIHHVLLTDELNASIVQHPRFGLFGWEENYLILGLPLLQAMSEPEALAVVAHEYGHLSGHHGRLGGFIYRFRSGWGRMQALSEQWQDWGSRLIARLFRWYAPYFNAYTFVLARQNEYVADRTSAEVAGPQHAANALMRVNLAAQFENEVFWPSVNKLVAEVPQPPEDRSAFWLKSVHEQLDVETRKRYLEVAAKRQTDHLDTHPALNDRLQAIGFAADETAAVTLVPPAASAAEIWLGDTLPPLLAEFDARWREDVSERWQSRHTQLAEQRQRLDALNAKESLTTDERWEIIDLTGDVQPEADLLPALNILLEMTPDHAAGRYRRGVWLLDKEDESGIADLEHVMTLDEGAILPACEAAWRFYHERDADKAEQFRQRWQDRSDYLDRVRTEFQSLPADATLAAHELDAEIEDRISRIVQENGKHIRRAYLLRRILKSDSKLHDYVLAFETGYLTLGNKGPTVSKRLAAQEFPVEIFVVHLGSQPYKRFRKPIKQLGIVPLTGQ